jgi:uncharacterized protein YjbI with pentapeptide repeats
MMPRGINLTVTGGDFSLCDFSGCSIVGDVSNTVFNNSNMMGARYGQSVLGTGLVSPWRFVDGACSPRMLAFCLRLSSVTSKPDTLVCFGRCLLAFSTFNEQARSRAGEGKAKVSSRANLEGEVDLSHADLTLADLSQYVFFAAQAL